MKKNIVFIIIILLLVLGLVGTIVATISMYNKNNNLNDEIASKSQEIETLNGEVSRLNDEVNKLNENSNTENSNAESSNTEEEFKHKLFDVSELGNESMKVLYRATGDNHLIARVDGQGNAFVSLISNDFYKYPNASHVVEYKVEGVSGKVYNTKVMMMGQGGAYTVFMIMEDGTLEYLDGTKISEGKFVSAGKIQGLEKVVDLVQVDLRWEKGGHIAVVALDVDGNMTLIQGL